jgi:hypothetical protein
MKTALLTRISKKALFKDAFTLFFHKCFHYVARK